MKSPAPDPEHARIPCRPRRAPAVAVAAAFACGIALDRGAGFEVTAWLVAGALVWIAWCAAFWQRSSRAAAATLVAACFVAGGARHHLHWSIRPENDIARYAADEPRLARIEGIVAAQPWIKGADPQGLGPGGMQADLTVALIECRRLDSDTGPISVAGLVRASVAGHLLHAHVGDRVEVQGWLSAPPQPANPGEYDFRDHLRRQKIGATLFVHHPDAVRVLAAGESLALRRWFARIRARCGETFAETVSSKRLAVAEALFLGDRAAMTDEINQAFAESGMMHLLAISGLHVGILAAFIWYGCCALRMNDSSKCLAVITLVTGYAFLTEGRPPVVRATIFVIIFAAGRPWFRQTTLGNTLAIAAIAVLVWNPADLYDVGAQLSFLAVWGMLWCGTLWRDAAARRESDIADVRWRAVARWVRPALRNYSMVAAIWLFTLPWVAARFNLISPAGFMLNVVLMPVIGALLCVGYATLFVGLAIPELAFLPGAILDQMLAFLLWSVDAASRWSLGHRYGPGPPGWWLAGYYALLVGLVAARGGWIARPRLPEGGLVRWGTLLGAWAIVGLAAPFPPVPREDFRCTFLSVGHGCAVLLEFPNGRTMLYDAGSLNDGRRAANAVQAALWTSGRRGINSLLVTHADIDHFNGIPHLLSRVPVGNVLIARPFLDWSQPAVAQFQATVEKARLPVRLVSAGDRLLADERVSLRVLNPPPGTRFDDDNANSIVLEIETAGRRILLTGDLEGPGLDRVVSSQSRPVDVLLAPHHGGAKANVRRLAEWAAPRWVIVSGDRRAPVDRLRGTYGDEATILSTARSGAIVCRIDSAGNLDMRPARTEKASGVAK